MQIHFTTSFLRFFFLVLFVYLNLHSLAAFAASGEKFYGYWYFGHDSNIKIGNKSTKSEYDRFMAEHPDLKASAWSISNTKFAGYAHKSDRQYLGGMVASGGYYAKPNAGELMSISISRVYASYLLFLFSNKKGLFIELSGGPVMAGYEKKRMEEVTYTASRSKQEYGYGASVALGYEFCLIKWFGVNIQTGYNFAHSAALGNVTWNEYGAAASLSF